MNRPHNTIQYNTIQYNTIQCLPKSRHWRTKRNTNSNTAHGLAPPEGVLIHPTRIMRVTPLEIWLRSSISRHSWCHDVFPTIYNIYIGLPIYMAWCLSIQSRKPDTRHDDHMHVVRLVTHGWADDDHDHWPGSVGGGPLAAGTVGVAVVRGQHVVPVPTRGLVGRQALGASCVDSASHVHLLGERKNCNPPPPPTAATTHTHTHTHTHDPTPGSTSSSSEMRARGGKEERERRMERRWLPGGGTLFLRQSSPPWCQPAVLCKSHWLSTLLSVAGCPAH